LDPRERSGGLKKGKAMKKTTGLMLISMVVFCAALTRAADPAATEASVRESEGLSTFTNGIGQGMHAVFVTATFDALMLPNGQVLVYPKDKGERIGNPLTLGTSIYYNDAVTSVERRMVTFANDKGPLMNPATIDLRGKLEDGVDYTLSYTFDKTGVSIRGYSRDPPGLKYPTIYRVAIWVPACTNFPPETLQTEREARLKGLSFVIQSGQKKVVHPYAKSALYAVTAEKCWIEGPVYGTRKLSFQIKSPDTTTMHPNIYSHSAPYGGYALFMQKSNAESRKPSERLVLTLQ
jgi:hypothetical protein